MQEQDFIYFRRRAAEERQAAERARIAAAAEAHRELAEHYESLAQSAISDRPDKVRVAAEG